MTFTSRNPTRFSSSLEEPRKTSPVPGVGRGKVIILKNTQSFYLTKGCPASETTLPKPSPVWEKGNYVTSGSSSLPVSSKRGEKMLWNTCEGYRLGTQAS